MADRKRPSRKSKGDTNKEKLNPIDEIENLASNIVDKTLSDHASISEKKKGYVAGGIKIRNRFIIVNDDYVEKSAIAMMLLLSSHDPNKGTITELSPYDALQLETRSTLEHHGFGCDIEMSKRVTKTLRGKITQETTWDDMEELFQQAESKVRLNNFRRGLGDANSRSR